MAWDRHSDGVGQDREPGLPPGPTDPAESAFSITWVRPVDRQMRRRCPSRRPVSPRAAWVVTARPVLAALGKATATNWCCRVAGPPVSDSRWQGGKYHIQVLHTNIMLDNKILFNFEPRTNSSGLVHIQDPQRILSDKYWDLKPTDNGEYYMRDEGMSMSEFIIGYQFLDGTQLPETKRWWHR